jgi:peptidoglycan/xylan/chitin deacetylase (PgdA/CDA1 family)
MRTSIRHAAIKTMHATGILKSARHKIAESGDTLVLTLHRVIPDNHIGSCRSPRGMVLRESAFRELLAYLKEHALVIRPDAISEKRKPDGRARVLLTFDDGWADNFSIAAPHLDRFGMSACFFMVTGYAGALQPFWPEHALGLVRALTRTDRKDSLRDVFGVLQQRGELPLQIENMQEEQLLTWLKQFRPMIVRSVIAEAEQRLATDITVDMPDPWERLMTWKELRSLARSGHAVASHTSTHALLTQLLTVDAVSELAESSAQLQQCMGEERVESQWISYPNGYSDSLVRELAYESGYRYGFTTVPGVWRTENEPLAIPRINIWDGALLSPEGNFDESYLEYTLFWRALRAANS